MVRTALAAPRLARGPARAGPASSSPPGRPRQLGPRRPRSSPFCPTGAVAREAARVERGRAPARCPVGPSVPAIEPAIASSGELRAARGPAASTLPSRDEDRRRARAGRLRRASPSPRAQAREGEARASSHAARRSPAPRSVAAHASRRRACRTLTGTAPRRRARRSGSPTANAGGGGRVGGARVGAPERRRGVALPGRGGVEQRAHRLHVAALPGLGELARGALGRRAAPRADTISADDERDRDQPPTTGRARWVRRRRRSAADGRLSGQGPRSLSQRSPVVPLGSSARDLARLDHRRLRGAHGGLGVRAGADRRRTVARRFRRRAPSSARASGRCCSPRARARPTRRCSR